MARADRRSTDTLSPITTRGEAHPSVIRAASAVGSTDPHLQWQVFSGTHHETRQAPPQETTAPHFHPNKAVPTEVPSSQVDAPPTPETCSWTGQRLLQNLQTHRAFGLQRSNPATQDDQDGNDNDDDDHDDHDDDVVQDSLVRTPEVPQADELVGTVQASLNAWWGVR